jgi:hypothetical protein
MFNGKGFTMTKAKTMTKEEQAEKFVEFVANKNYKAASKVAALGRGLTPEDVEALASKKVAELIEHGDTMPKTEPNASDLAMYCQLSGGDSSTRDSGARRVFDKLRKDDWEPTDATNEIADLKTQQTK